jgi:hypothetical protein
MKRMNLRDVPDEVYLALAEGAEASQQSLNAFVVERLTEVVQVLGITGYAESYEPPSTALRSKPTPSAAPSTPRVVRPGR